MKISTTLRKGVLVLALSGLLAACNGGSDDVTPPPVQQNQAPEVTASSDVETVMETETATLVAEATDSDGTIQSYAWEQTAGDVSVTLSSAADAEPTFVAPDVYGDTLVTFTVTVTDNDGATASDEVSITITNTPAEAVILSDVTEMDELSTISLAAETNTGWTYEWAQTVGTSGTFSAATDAVTDYTAPNVESDETATFLLTVTDDKGRTATAEHDVLVKNIDFSVDWISRISAAPESSVNLQLSREATADDRVVLGTTEITPSSINADQLTFEVPTGAKTGVVYVRTGEMRSANQLWLEVSTEGGLAAAHPERYFVSPVGEKVVRDYVLVILENSATDETAATVAASVGGEVIGKEVGVNLYQISVTAADYAELQAVVAALAGDSAVVSAMMDLFVEEDAIDWSGDPAIGEQRDRNNVELGAQNYVDLVGSSAEITPMFMALGISEAGVDYTQVDFDGFAGSASTMGNMTLYAPSSAVSTTAGSHGTNVTGLMAGELGDGGNAGLLTAVADSHGGAAIVVNSGSGTISGRLASTLSMARAGAGVINWSWGVHRIDGVDTDEDGIVSGDEIIDGAMNCAGEFTDNNVVSDAQFGSIQSLLNAFFDEFREKHSQTVIVATAGNGATNAGDTNNRLPSSMTESQMIIVGAHTSGGIYSDGTSEDERAASGFATSCFDTATTADVKRAHYSNYGERVDITASGSIAGWNGSEFVSAQGTSYAAPVVAATVALVQSIDPTMTPAEIKALLRSSALPIENTVTGTAMEDVVTRPLTADESEHVGSGARLNVAGAISAAASGYGSGGSGGGSGGSVGDPIEVGIGGEAVTQTISFTVPETDIYDAVDIMFLVDVSGSYYDDLSTFRTQAAALIDEFLGAGRNVNIGLSSFSEFSSWGASYDYEYRLDVALTNDSDAIITGLDELSILNGGDGPESQYEALYRAASVESGWRPTSLPLIFLATDANFHDSDTNPSYPGKGRIETIERLLERKTRVYGLQAGGAISQLEELAEVTGGETFLLSRNSSEIVEAVISALDSTTTDLTITLEPFGDFAGIVTSVIPTDVEGAENGDPIEGVQPGDTVNFDVTFDRSSIPPGESVTFSFRLRIVIDGSAVIHEIPVVVTIEG